MQPNIIPHLPDWMTREGSTKRIVRNVMTRIGHCDKASGQLHNLCREVWV